MLQQFGDAHIVAMLELHLYTYLSSQIGWDTDQPDIAEDVPAYCREVGLADL